MEVSAIFEYNDGGVKMAYRCQLRMQGCCDNELVRTVVALIVVVVCALSTGDGDGQHRPNTPHSECRCPSLRVSLSNHSSCFWPPLSFFVFRMADLAIGRWLQRMWVAVAGSISARREWARFEVRRSISVNKGTMAASTFLFARRCLDTAGALEYLRQIPSQNC